MELLGIRLLPVFAVAAGIVMMYLACVNLCIRRRKRRMRDYADFIRDTYAPEEDVPVLIRRYYQKEVDSYNSLAGKCFFRMFWKRASGDDFRPDNRNLQATCDKAVQDKSSGTQKSGGLQRPPKYRKKAKRQTNAMKMK